MSKDIQVKNFRVTLVRKPEKINEKFEVDIRAVSKEDAIDMAFSRIGSKHRVPRKLLRVASVKEIKLHDLKDSILKEIAANDKIKIPESKQ
jgi:large subunit ribosomal protein LX